MAFINTIDALGDEVVFNSLVDRSITEYVDDTLTYLGPRAFTDCTNLKKVDLVVSSGIADQFQRCTSLISLVLRSQTIVPLNNILTGLGSTPIYNGGGTGYIYVPRALVDSYKSATNWSTFANQFRALEDYTVDGTITGELDETKIAA